jgi:hypothetical protein
LPSEKFSHSKLADFLRVIAVLIAFGLLFALTSVGNSDSQHSRTIRAEENLSYYIKKRHIVAHSPTCELSKAPAEQDWALCTYKDKTNNLVELRCVASRGLEQQGRFTCVTTEKGHPP